MGSGFRTFQSGEVLTSSNVQNFLMDQAVTVFAGTAARGSAIASPETGMVSYRTDGTADLKREGFEFYDGSGWVRMIPAAPASGLTLISSTTIGSAVASVTVTDAFSSTYDNYLITVNGGTASTSNVLRMTLGSTTANYYYGGTNVTFGGSSTSISGNNVAFWIAGYGETGLLEVNAVVGNPNVAKNSTIRHLFVTPQTGGAAGFINGVLNDTTQYTAFTLTTNTGTITGGTIRVYGYQI